ncbi:MAG: FkbM family methyltransferase [Oricola sp.]
MPPEMGARLRALLRKIQVPQPVKRWLRRQAAPVVTARFPDIARDLHCSAARRKAFFDAGFGEYLVACGPETYVVSTSDAVIGREVFAHGEFEFGVFERVRALAGLPADGVTLVDVGANIGVTSLPAVKRGLVARAIAIEPEPSNLRLLKANTALNGLGDAVTIVACAAGEETGGIEFELSPDNHGDHRVRRSGPVRENCFGEAGRQTIAVDVRTLDDILAGEDIASALLWIDTQGYEGFVLAGATRTLARKFPLVIEFWPYGMDQSGSYPRLVKALAASPYTRFHALRDPDGEPRPLTVENLDALKGRLTGPEASTDLLIL